MFTNEQRVGDICKNINEKLSNTKRSFCKKIECSLSDLMLNVSDSLSQARCPIFFFLRILFFKSFFSGHCFQLLNSSRRPGVILFPDFGCFSFSLKHHGSVLLVLSSETDKHKNLKYSLEEKKQWNSQTQKAFSDLPIWNLYLVWVILSDSVEPVLFQ